MEKGPIDLADDEKKKRIEYYKNTLKYYRSRALSLEAILASKQQVTRIPDDMKTYQMLNKNIKELHEGIMLLQSLKECLQLINNSVTCFHLNVADDFNFKGEIMSKVNGIIYFSKSIMKLYSEKISELDVILKKKDYTAALDEYGKHLVVMKELKNGLGEEVLNASEKAELQVYKINLIRAIKAILIGFTSVNYPDLIQQFQQYRSPLRRNLTIEDFTETWDVGLT